MVVKQDIFVLGNQSNVDKSPQTTKGTLRQVTAAVKQGKIIDNKSKDSHEDNYVEGG